LIVEVIDMLKCLVSFCVSFWGGRPAIRAARPSVPGSGRLRGVGGQTTAEYALVLLGAAAIASLVISWASGTDAVGRLMDFVMAHIIGSVR
jgi:hypothetical protein